eukprot:1742355-Rhodomonas_salina.1
MPPSVLSSAVPVALSATAVRQYHGCYYNTQTAPVRSSLARYAVKPYGSVSRYRAARASTCLALLHTLVQPWKRVLPPLLPSSLPLVVEVLVGVRLSRRLERRVREAGGRGREGGMAAAVLRHNA